jgi:predicted tellurium resistance membrane protein TerC
MTHGVILEMVASLATLTFLEIILGIDNIVFLAVAVEGLPEEKRSFGRQVSLWAAMGLRIAMLSSLVWLEHLDAPLMTVIGRPITIKDLVLILGGLFLIAKGTTEVHHAIEKDAETDIEGRAKRVSLTSFFLQTALINIIFSLDSVITAVGMTSHLWVMITAVVASTIVMLFAARPVAEFIQRRPTTKLLALAFILLIGVALVADGLGVHLPRGYIYFAIAFSLFVEMLNIAQINARRRALARRASGTPPKA